MILRVDRLSIRMEGTNASDGRRLAHVLARRLAEANVSLTARDAERLNIQLATRGGESIELLAERIANELIRAIGGAT